MFQVSDWDGYGGAISSEALGIKHVYHASRDIMLAWVSYAIISNF